METEDLALLNLVLDDTAPASGESAPSFVAHGLTEAPLSFAQERLWFLEQLNPNTDTYHIPFAFQLSGDLDTHALKKSIETIIQRHGILRTTFYASGQEPRQKLVAGNGFIVGEDDLSHLSPNERQTTLDDRIEDLSRQPFQLDQWPLFRGHIFKTTESTWTVALVLHHIISDGWSTGIFIDELMQLYATFSQKAQSTSPRPALTHQYFDYALWQKESIAQGSLNSQITYWEEKLQGLEDTLLPTDFPRPKIQSTEGSSLPIMIQPALQAKLDALMQEEALTAFMLLLGAYAWTLTRYTGKQEVAIGTPVAGRSRPECEGLIGFFVNSVPLRIELQRANTPREILRTVKQTTLDGLTHAEVPLELLVEKLKPNRNLGHHPLFQVMFTVEQAGTPLKFPGLDLTPLPNKTHSAKFDLTLSFQESPNGLAGSLIYNKQLFAEQTMLALLDCYQATLQQFADAPDATLHGNYSLPASHRNMYRDWGTGHSQTSARSVLEQIQQHAQNSPDSRAIITEDHPLTYAELDHRSNAITHQLKAIHLPNHAHVAVILPRDHHWVSTLLGIWKANAAWVSLDASHPVDRLKHLIDESSAQAIITTSELAEKFKELAQPTLIAKTIIEQENAEERSEETCIHCPPSAPAYLIFTSGSTGTPKAVVVSHGSLTNLVSWHNRQFKVTPQSQATQIASAAFDASVWELWPYLATGASVYIPSADLVQSGPATYREWLESHPITHTFAPTPLAESLLQETWSSESSIQYLLTGGDRLRVFPTEHIPFKLINNYGPTENAVVATSGQITPDALSKRLPSLGAPIDNNDCYILDSTLQPVPLGAIGELYIGGHSLASHYHNQPALTAESFIPHPTPKRPGERLYKTGDTVRLSTDGQLAFLGRRDHQIKIRGHRIELGEIERTLLQHPSLREVAVQPFQPNTASTDHSTLIAYCVPSDTSIDYNTIKAFLSEKLPGYMVPSRFIQLASMPLNASGKLDRKALPTPSQERPQLQNSYRAPSNPTEQAITDIWSQHLGIEQVGIDDNFFDLGGHSMLLLKVQQDLVQSGFQSLRVVDLFSHPTVHELAQFLSQPANDSEQLTERFKNRQAQQKQAFQKRKQSYQRFRKK